MNVKGPRHHNIKSDYGIRDYYKYYHKNGGVESYNVFAKCVREFHTRIGDYLIKNEYTFKLPFKLGGITVRKIKTYVKFDDKGRLRTNLPINWKETNKYWDEHPEERKKVYIRHENKQTNGVKYSFHYIKKGALYHNKSIYTININRQLKRRFKEYICSVGEIERGMQYEIRSR